jgi:hypothetical protein
MAVHAGSVGDPPEVDPVGVDLYTLAFVLISRIIFIFRACWTHLMVRHLHHSLRKVAFQSPIFCLPQLSPHTRVSTDPHLNRGPPVCHGHVDYAEVLFRHGHPCIEEILAIEVERRANELGDGDTEAKC